MKTLPNELILLDLISSKELANELEKLPKNANVVYSCVNIYFDNYVCSENSTDEAKNTIIRAKKKKQNINKVTVTTYAKNKDGIFGEDKKVSEIDITKLLNLKEL